MPKVARKRPAQAPRPTPDETSRLQTLATELTLAGAQVLQEEFGFTQEQTNAWMKKTLERAKANRAKLWTGDQGTGRV